MEITTSFSAASLQELHKARRRWPYWPLHFTGGSSRFLALLMGVAAFALYSLYNGLTGASVDGDGILMAITTLVLIAGYFGVITYRDRAKLRKEASSSTSIHLTFDDTGFFTKSTRYEWALFSAFTFGSSIVFLLYKDSQKKRMVIPIDKLSKTDAAQLRAILLSHLPER